jgi:hypothetical protein
MDVNTESYAGQDGVIVEGRTLVPNKGDSDSLKFSNCTNFRVTSCEIHGGLEDTIDINRGTNGLIENCKLVPAGLYTLTVKGGFKNLTIKNTEIVGSGKETGIDIGNWSSQGRWAWTKNVKLENVYSSDGKPVIVRVMWGSKPKVVGGNVKIEDWRIKAFFYFIYKTIYVKLTGKK